MLTTFSEMSHIYQYDPDAQILHIRSGTYDGPARSSLRGWNLISEAERRLDEDGELQFPGRGAVLVCYLNELDEYAITLLVGQQAEIWLYGSEPSDKTDTVSRRLLVRRCMFYPESR